MRLTLIAMLATTAVAMETRASKLIISHSLRCKRRCRRRDQCHFLYYRERDNVTHCAQSMYFYVKSGSAWTLEKSYGQYSAGMNTTNKVTYDNTITYQGTKGAQYKIVVTLFVKDSEGASDTRTYTKYV